MVWIFCHYKLFIFLCSMSHSYRFMCTDRDMEAMNQMAHQWLMGSCAGIMHVFQNLMVIRMKSHVFFQKGITLKGRQSIFASIIRFCFKTNVQAVWQCILCQNKMTVVSPDLCMMLLLFDFSRHHCFSASALSYVVASDALRWTWNSLSEHIACSSCWYLHDQAVSNIFNSFHVLKVSNSFPRK